MLFRSGVDEPVDVLSALKGENVDGFVDALVAHLPESPPMFPPEQWTDREERDLRRPGVHDASGFLALWERRLFAGLRIASGAHGSIKSPFSNFYLVGRNHQQPSLSKLQP